MKLPPNTGKDRPATTFQVFHRADGSIAALVMAQFSGPGPQASIFAPDGCSCCEIELDRELAGMDPLEIHEGFQVDLKSKTPRLVRRPDCR